MYEDDEEEEEDEDGSPPARPDPRRRRGDEPIISPATAIGARDDTDETYSLDSALGRFFTRPRGAARGGAGVSSAGRAASTRGGGGGASSSFAADAGFGRLPASAAPDSTVSICATMSSDEVFACLQSVASRQVLAGLAGHLAAHVTPTLAMVSGCVSHHT